MRDDQTSTSRRDLPDLTVAIIGHTGRGNYGHWLDEAFDGVIGTRVVAVADPDEAGRARVVAKVGASRGYADYRLMLDRERPDIAVVASREIGDHHRTVLDVAARACHVYLEKPVAATPAEVDEMVAACDAACRHLVVAHPWRGHQAIQEVALPALRSGLIGEPRVGRVFGMGGRHGGNELFIDLAPHFFDLLWQLAGDPLWCQAHVTESGRTSTVADLRRGDEGMGLVAGDGITAYYAWDRFAAHVESYRSDGREVPYRVDIHGTEGTMSLPGPMGTGPDVWVHPLVNPPLRGDDRWQAIVDDDGLSGDRKWVRAHHRMAAAMVRLIHGDAPGLELVDGRHAGRLLEMAFMAHAAHRAGSRVAFPLLTRKNPYEGWA